MFCRFFEFATYKPHAFIPFLVSLWLISPVSNKESDPNHFFKNRPRWQNLSSYRKHVECKRAKKNKERPPEDERHAISTNRSQYLINCVRAFQEWFLLG